jgi:hypothetical protein
MVVVTVELTLDTSMIEEQRTPTAFSIDRFKKCPHISRSADVIAFPVKSQFMLNPKMW